MIFEDNYLLILIFEDGYLLTANDRIENEVDNSICEERDNEANNGIEDGVFSVGNLFAVTTGENIAEAAINKHNNRDETND